MKKIYLLTAALMLSLTLAACGAEEQQRQALSDAADDAVNDGDAGNAEAVKEVVAEAVAEAVEYNAFSLAAATAFWNDKGIDVEAASPDWEWIVNEERMTTYGDKLDSPYGHASIAFEKEGGEVSEEDFRSWAEKMFAATAAASDDGHNIVGWEFAGDGEDALAQVSFDDMFNGSFMMGWGFMRNGRNMVVYISEDYTTDKDSEIGRPLYNFAVSADVCFGMEKSMDDAFNDIDAAFNEYGDEIEDALNDYLD